VVVLPETEKAGSIGIVVGGITAKVEPPITVAVRGIGAGAVSSGRLSLDGAGSGEPGGVVTWLRGCVGVA